MQRDEIRQTVSTQFFESLAESGTQITALPQDQLKAVVEAMGDAMFAAIAAVEDEQSGVPADVMAMSSRAIEGEEEDVEETELWRGRPYFSIGTIYVLTTQRIRIIKGVVGKRIDDVELVRIRDIRVKQHVGERMLAVGDVTILSNDQSNPETVLQNIKQPVEVHDMIRKAMLAEKKRRGFAYREEM
ncbi:MAG: PH domain-containing protein [Caldilineaceae bacterium]|nr:PH domain-containing protein [Caldilineaceae bacterium]